MWEDNLTLMEERDFYGFYGIHFVKLVESLTSKSEEEIISLMENDLDSLKKILEEAFEKKVAAILV